MTTPNDPQAAAIDRTLTDGKREGSPTRVATVSRSYPTSPQDLWDAVTDPDRIGRWFTSVTGDLSLGGHYQLKDNAAGTITVCDPPRSFSATWEFGGGISWIMVTVEPEGADARLTIEHSSPVSAEADGFWDTYGPGAVGVG
ncbi:SRPBCC family protein [Brevibacterium sp.]|uniref:SRPBCC family protein n=1 Tax=Brevibacterium sp. TaxID=1701 RepID=UPI002811423C|nr:SRPBCC family protein [Brevibacterium sp.]